MSEYPDLTKSPTRYILRVHDGGDNVESSILGPNPMTPLCSEQFLALRESIKEHGVMVPVLLNQHGRVIDGHYRSTIGKELGVEVPSTVKHYNDASDVGGELTDEELVDALLLNAQRRQLDDYSAGQLNLKLLELYGIESRPGRRPVGQKTTAEIAALAGQSMRTFQRRVALAKLLASEEHTEVRDQLVAGSISTREALQQVSPDTEDIEDIEKNWETVVTTIGSSQALDDLSSDDQSDEDTIDSVTQSRLAAIGLPIFKEYDEDIKTEFCCPKCGYEWSGSGN